MAKKPAKTIKLLSAIHDGSVKYIGRDDGLPLIQTDPPLIEVNTESLDPNDNTKAAVRLTDAGLNYIGVNTVTDTATETTTPASPYAIIKNAALPASKRGGRGGGAPKQYPFDELEVGDTFFVPVSEKHPNPVKTLGSTVSSANNRYAVSTGEQVEKVRTKRGSGNRAVKDENGNNVRETVTVEKKRFTRKFTLRAVKAGQTYGEFVAPSDGALIGRVQ